MTSSKSLINKILLKALLLAVAVLCIPLIAMQFTLEVQWTLLDFAVMAILVVSTVSSYLIAAHVFPKFKVYLLIFASCSFLLIWTEMAVGLVTSLLT